MRVLLLLLYPFAVLYDLITHLRNRLFDLGYKPSASFEVPLISVGNITAGGTGKTPMIEHLIRLLKPNYKVATLSRGYGRSTRGIRFAKAGDDATTLGDEPYQFYRKFGEEVTVVVAEERALAISYLLDEHPETQVVLLDDAYQHRQVKPSFQILLTDYGRLFYKDFLLPSGRLRESARGASRADVVVVTKCPRGISNEEKMQIEAAVRKYTARPVFFASVRYGDPLLLSHSQGNLRDNVILVSGLANTRALANYVSRRYKIIRHFDFPDHYRYRHKDLAAICKLAKKHDAFILTTEKDATKLEARQFQSFLSQTSFYYLPIETEFLKNGRDFDMMVLNAFKNA